MFSRSLANGSFVGGVAIEPVSGSNIAGNHWVKVENRFFSQRPYAESGVGLFIQKNRIGNSLCNVFTRSLKIRMAIIGRASNQARRETRGFFYSVHGSATIVAIVNW